jgi:hypothetical protein
MDLVRRFTAVAECKYIRACSMVIDKEYSIYLAMRAVSGYGAPVYIFINDFLDSSTVYKVLLPFEYSETITVKDLEDINEGKISLKIVYRGKNKYGTDVLELIM